MRHLFFVTMFIVSLLAPHGVSATQMSLNELVQRTCWFNEASARAIMFSHQNGQSAGAIIPNMIDSIQTPGSLDEFGLEPYRKVIVSDYHFLIKTYAAQASLYSIHSTEKAKTEMVRLFGGMKKLECYRHYYDDGKRYDVK